MSYDLEQVSHEKDLGIITDDHLKFHVNITSAIQDQSVAYCGKEVIWEPEYIHRLARVQVHGHCPDLKYANQI